MNERPQNKHLKPFKPGQSGNPSGKPRGLLTRSQVEALISKFSSLTRDQMQVVIQNPKSTMIEIMVASIMAKASKDGDYSRLQFLLERSIGKVKEQLEMLMPKPVVINRRDGTQLILGAEKSESENE